MSSSDAKSGSYCARHRWASSSSNYIFTKAVTVTSGNEYELQYYTRAYSASFPESFYVKVGTAQTGASQSTTISTESNITSTSYVSKTATWIATFSGTAYFSFHCTSDDEFYLYLDDVTLTETSTCTPPTTQASSLVFSNVGLSQIDISWTRGNGNNVLVIAKAASAHPHQGASATPWCGWLLRVIRHHAPPAWALWLRLSSRGHEGAPFRV